MGLLNIICGHDYAILGKIIAGIRCEQFRQVLMSVCVLQNFEKREFNEIFQLLAKK